MVLKKMQVCLVSPLAKVDLAHPVGVDGVPLVGVDNNLNTFCSFQSISIRQLKNSANSRVSLPQTARSRCGSSWPGSGSSDSRRRTRH